MPLAIAVTLGVLAVLPPGTAEVLKVVQRVFDGIVDALVAEGRIELRNFGVFEVKKSKAREARNPRTGEAVMVPARNRIRFKAGMEMAEKVEALGE